MLSVLPFRSPRMCSPPTDTNEPLDVGVVVPAIVSFLDVLLGVGQFQGQSLTPQLLINANPPLLLVALHTGRKNTVTTRTIPSQM